jgi:hypothetical protein
METVQTNSMKISKRAVLSLLKRWPIRLAILILAAAALVKWQSTWLPTDTGLPANPPPLSDNAKDIIAQATQVMDHDIDQIAPYGAPASSISSTRNSTGVYNAGNTSAVYYAYTPAEKDEIVRRNIPAFDKLEQSFAYPYQDNTKPSFNAVYTYFSQDRDLARALRTAAEVKAAHGDWNTAVKYDLDAVQMGGELSNNTILIGVLVGVACEAIGRRDLYGYVGHLNSAQADAAAKRLLAIDASSPPPSQSLVDEGEFTKAALLDMFRQKHWRDSISASFGASGEPPDDWVVRTALAVESPRTAYDNFTDYNKRAIQNAEIPWPAQIKTTEPEPARDLINQVLDSPSREILFKSYYSQVYNRLLATQLALQAYHLNHGTYPSTLIELIPKYLPSVPIDPFSDEQPLKYRIDGGKYLLYSIGPDAVDDGGNTIFDLHHKTQPYLLWDMSEKGDVVSGIGPYLER